jgi:hypothetical protein
MADAQQTTLRDMLSASMDAAEQGTISNAQDAPQIPQDPVVTDDPQQEPPQGDRPRDEHGRFAAKGKDEGEPEKGAPPLEEKAELTPENAVTAQPEVQRPTTWKKEYLPIWDKIATGQNITPDEAKKLAAYSVQREREYATGVSTYKQEAQNAKHLTEALAPFSPLLQKQNMRAEDFIKNLGSTYQFLVEGSPQQKLQAFAQLAQSVGIPLQAIAQSQGGQLDPIIPQLMQEIQNLRGQVTNVASWREQQEQQDVQNQIAKFENNPKDFPHFQAVRGTMGRLLETGLATDLETAYAKAIRMHDDVWQSEMERQAPLSAPAAPTQDKAAAAAAAKAKAVSVRSATPTGNTKPVDAKDLRSALENSFSSIGSRV